MGIKINRLDIENVKRVKAVQLSPSKNGLTIIGGNNDQGKTSVLDAITWALGGENYRPSKPKRQGSATDPYLKIVMDNGLVVERKGKNSSLKVTDPDGNRAGQALLNDFIGQFALDLPKFMGSSGKDKANVLLKIIGVGEQLAALEKEEKDLYNERLYTGRTADQKEKFAKEQPYYPDAPDELVSPSDLIRQQQEILARNGENQRKRDRAASLNAERSRLIEKINQLQGELDKYREQLAGVNDDMLIANKSVQDLQDESTAELEQSIANIEEINRKVRANLDKEKAEDDAKGYRREYQALTEAIAEVRKKKRTCLHQQSCRSRNCRSRMGTWFTAGSSGIICQALSS